MKINTETIWKGFHKELLRFIKKRVKDEEIAKDLLQDVFVKIHLRHSTLSDSNKLASWVYQITRNCIIDYYRSNKQFIGVSADIYELEEPLTYNKEFSKCLEPFINGISETYREAILQTELGLLSQKEFAEKSNISYSGAKSRIQRGRKELFKIFKQCCQFSTDKYGNILEYESKRKCSDC